MADDCRSPYLIYPMRTACSIYPKRYAAKKSYALSISDTGTGMSPPFLKGFSSHFIQLKVRRKAPAWDWRWCSAFVVQCGGHIRVSSQVGEGTTFYIYLPTTRRRLTDDLQRLPGAAKPPVRFTRILRRQAHSVMTKRTSRLSKTETQVSAHSIGR